MASTVYYVVVLYAVLCKIVQNEKKLWEWGKNVRQRENGAKKRKLRQIYMKIIINL